MLESLVAGSWMLERLMAEEPDGWRAGWLESRMAGELSGWEVLMLLALRAGHRHPDSQERMEEVYNIQEDH